MADAHERPPIDPAVGSEAAEQVAQVRRTMIEGMEQGTLTLEELFRIVDIEEPKHQVGHMHLRAALLALPYIGDRRADKILGELGIPGDRHLAAVGPKQREKLLELYAEILATGGLSGL